MWKARNDDSDEIYRENSRKSRPPTWWPRCHELKVTTTRRTTSIKTKGWKWNCTFTGLVLFGGLDNIGLRFLQYGRLLRRRLSGRSTNLAFDFGRLCASGLCSGIGGFLRRFLGLFLYDFKRIFALIKKQRIPSTTKRRHEVYENTKTTTRMLACW